MSTCVVCYYYDADTPAETTRWHHANLHQSRCGPTPLCFDCADSDDEDLDHPDRAPGHCDAPGCPRKPAILTTSCLDCALPVWDRHEIRDQHPDGWNSPIQLNAHPYTRCWQHRTARIREITEQANPVSLATPLRHLLTSGIYRRPARLGHVSRWWCDMCWRETEQESIPMFPLQFEDGSTMSGRTYRCLTCRCVQDVRPDPDNPNRRDIADVPVAAGLL